MIFDVNIDDVDEILSIRTSLIKGTFVESGGLTVVSWSSEGTTVSKQWAMSPKTLLEETRAFLQQYDPELYGTRVKKVLPQYTQ